MTEAPAAATLRENRWQNQVYCVYCSSYKIVKNGKREDGIQQYRCKACEKSFNDRTKTVFGETQMHLQECFEIIRKNRNGASIRSISKKLDRSWKTVNDFIRAYKTSMLPTEIISDYEDRKGSDIDYSKFGCGNSLHF